MQGRQVNVNHLIISANMRDNCKHISVLLDFFSINKTFALLVKIVVNNQQVYVDWMYMSNLRKFGFRELKQIVVAFWIFTRILAALKYSRILKQSALCRRKYWFFMFIWGLIGTYCLLTLDLLYKETLT